MVLSKTIGISFSFNSAVFKPFEYILLYLSVKKSNSILAAAISGCVYLILHYGEFISGGFLSFFINATNPQPAPPKYELVASDDSTAYLLNKETGDVWGLKRTGSLGKF